MKMDLFEADHFDNSHRNPEVMMEPMIKRINLILDSLSGKAVLIDGYDV